MLNSPKQGKGVWLEVPDPILTWLVCLVWACKRDFISLSLGFPESQEGEMRMTVQTKEQLNEEWNEEAGVKSDNGRQQLFSTGINHGMKNKSECKTHRLWLVAKHEVEETNECLNDSLTPRAGGQLSSSEILDYTLMLGSCWFHFLFLSNNYWVCLALC